MNVKALTSGFPLRIIKEKETILHEEFTQCAERKVTASVLLGPLQAVMGRGSPEPVGESQDWPCSTLGAGSWTAVHPAYSSSLWSGRQQSPSTPPRLVGDTVLNLLHVPSASNPEHGLILQCLPWMCAARSPSIFLPSLLLWQPPTAGVPRATRSEHTSSFVSSDLKLQKLFPALHRAHVQGVLIRIDFIARQERAPLNSPNTWSPQPRPVTRLWRHSDKTA